MPVLAKGDRAGSAVWLGGLASRPVLLQLGCVPAEVVTQHCCKKKAAASLALDCRTVRLWSGLVQCTDPKSNLFFLNISLLHREVDSCPAGGGQNVLHSLSVPSVWKPANPDKAPGRALNLHGPSAHQWGRCGKKVGRIRANLLGKWLVGKQLLQMLRQKLLLQRKPYPGSGSPHISLYLTHVLNMSEMDGKINNNE